MKFFLVSMVAALVLAFPLSAQAYLPGEGGSYYRYENTGVPCGTWPGQTWKREQAWTGSGWAYTGRWTCF